MLSETQIASPRRAFERLLATPVTIIRSTRADTASGRWETTETTEVVMGTLAPANVLPREGVVNLVEGSKSRWWLRVPVGTVISAGDEVEALGERYRVTGLIGPRSTAFTLRVLLEQVE
jgi:hypothetical protein